MYICVCVCINIHIYPTQWLAYSKHSISVEWLNVQIKKKCLDVCTIYQMLTEYLWMEDVGWFILSLLFLYNWKNFKQMCITFIIRNGKRSVCFLESKRINRTWLLVSGAWGEWRCGGRCPVFWLAQLPSLRTKLAEVMEFQLSYFKS